MTLLLGPPGAGKTTLLKALAGKLQNTPDLKVHLPFLTGWLRMQECCTSCWDRIMTNACRLCDEKAPN